MRWASLYGGGGGLVAKWCPTLATPWTVAHQAPLPMGSSRQEYWSVLPFPIFINPLNLHSVCQQIWKTEEWPQDWKRSVFFPIPKNAQTTAQLHSSHTLVK